MIVANCSDLVTYFNSVLLMMHQNVAPCWPRELWISFMAGRHKRRPEPGFSFIRFTSAYVCSFQ